MMKKQLGRTTVYIIVSLLIHLTILLYLPGVDFNIKLKQKEVFNIDLIKVPVKSIKADLTGSQGLKTEAKGEKKEKTPSSSGLLKPSVELPIVSVMEKIPFSETINQKNNISVTSKKNVDESLGKEIAASESKLKTGSASVSGNSKVVSSGKSDFFELSSSSKGDRKIVYIPEKPSFSLESNTKVRLRFSIDSKGVPYSIILLSRSNPQVEKLAIKFVSGLRFESVSYKDVDTAEITVYFNVR
jgi:hypothetical protein